MGMLALSERIRQARETNGWNRAELARQVGVAASAAVQWENVGGTIPAVENLIKIAKLTGVAFEWLATGRGASRVQPPYETPAVEIASFAHNLFEERLLLLARSLPRKAHEPLLDFLATILPRQPAASKRKSTVRLPNIRRR